MPNQGRRSESDCADFLQAPASIYIVTRRAKCRVEASDLLQGSPPNREIASRNVLSDFIRQ